MDYIILEKKIRSSIAYDSKKYNHEDMYHLSCFLTDDVAGITGVERWIARMHNPNFIAVECNFCFLENKGEYILIGMVPTLLTNEENPYEDAFRIPKQQLVYILEQWKQVRINKPDEVIITRENDVYQVIQKSNDMSQA